MNGDNIFKYFDNNTKKVLINCQKISQDMHVPTGTDHLLLAIMLTPNSPGSKLLKEYMISSDKINFVLKVDDFKETKSKNDLTLELKHILKMAIDNSIKYNKKKISIEDLMIAILNYKNCAAYKIIEKLGIDIQDISKKISESNLKHTFEQNSNVNPDSDFGDFIFGSNHGQNGNSDFGFESQPFEAFGPQLNLGQKTKTKNYLDEFGIDLNKLAKEKKLENLVGREKETKRIIQILCRKTKNNPVLVGEPGVGKTAIVEGLAQKIVENKVPQYLHGKRIIMVDLAMAVAGTMYRGQFESRIKQILKEASQNKDIILFIDEIHNIIGTGSAEGSMDTANILKPILAKGEIRLIGSTTFDEYRKHIEKDSALERRLQKIIVNEPTAKETLQILKGVRNGLEEFHGIIISDQALETAVKLSARYIFDRFLPDKAIDLIDEAASTTKIENAPTDFATTQDLNKKLESIIKNKFDSINTEDFAKAAYFRTQELQVKQEIAVLKKKKKINSDKKIIGSTEVAKIVSSWTQIPIDNLIRDDLGEIKNLEKKLSSFIIGQDEAIKLVSSSIKKTKTQLVNPERPLGTFIFLGPTGVGKTELAKTLARVVFGSENKLIKIDMSEFMEKHNIARLVGSPPGYVGYEDAGRLTEAVRNNPYSVVLLDEIEKANPEVYNLLLQIIEDGYLTDAKGRRVNFKNTVIIMTSNIGINELNRQAAIGFKKSQPEENYTNLKKKIFGELKNTFKPELINRIDNIIIFKPLDKDSIAKITDLQLLEISKRLKSMGISIEFSSKAKNFIAQKSYNPEYGARVIRRTIDKFITAPLSDALIENKNIKKIKVLFTKDKIDIRTN